MTVEWKQNENVHTAMMDGLEFTVSKNNDGWVWNIGENKIERLAYKTSAEAMENAEYWGCCKYNDSN